MKLIFNDFEIIKRSGNIILSSPHCKRQFREGKIKAKEIRTGTLVKKVSSKTRSSCIYRSKYAQNDPNYDKISTYKSELVDFIKDNNIKLLIDVHGMRASRDVDICIGTDFGKNVLYNEKLVNLFETTFLKYGYKNVTIDDPFSATYPYTVSSYVSRTAHIPCIQVEINNKYTHSRFDTFDFDNLVKCFTEVVNKASCFLTENAL